MLSKLVEDNYKEILVAAKRITRRRNSQHARELINESYLMIVDSEIPKDDKGFIEFFTKTMFNQHLGKRSRFNKAITMKECYLDYDPGSDDWKDMELLPDQQNEETINLIKELSHLTKDKALKYNEVLITKNSLPPHEKELFDLHFEKGLSSREIARVLETQTGWKMSHMRVNDMLRTVKNKIHGRS